MALIASLCSYIEEQATFKLPPNKEIIIAGGYDNNENCYTITCEGVKELVHLKSNHQEADTRLILHLIDRAENKDRRVLIKADDTDVLILLLYYFWAKELRSEFLRPKLPKRCKPCYWKNGRICLKS
jgi:hypothetical protein